ncbi:ABC transporter substrate-binding protein, partial [Pseudomonas sp. MOB-449]|nr:ABC transporter substrate-binding protein [Pseudomonas sp. MOB-449]
LDTYQLLGPNSPGVLYTTEKFREENPKTYQAFVAALAEAAEFAQNDKAAAADTYIRVTKANISKEALLEILDNEQFQFSVTPTGTFQLAEFLHRVGALKNKPASWQDY